MKRIKNNEGENMCGTSEEEILQAIKKVELYNKSHNVIVDHEYEVDGTGIDDIPFQSSVWFSCRNCGETVIDMDDHWIFYEKCPHCNQPIDWNGWDNC